MANLQLSPIYCLIAVGGGAAAVILGGLSLDAQVRLVGLMALFAAGCLLLTLGVTLRQIGIATLLLLVLGYSMQGRAFAYWGVAPLFVGEVVLGATAAITMTLGRWRNWHAIGWLIVAFIGLGAIRTIPFLGVYRLDAARDAAIWYYACFALILFNLMPYSGVDRTLQFFTRILPYAAVWYLGMSTILEDYFLELPSLPGSPLPIFATVNAGHRGVVLAAMAAIMLTQIHARLPGRRRVEQWIFWVAWLGSTVILASTTRGGFLAVVAAAGVIAFMMPSARWLKYGYFLVILSVGLIVANPTFNFGHYREVSVTQLIANFSSILTDSQETQGSVTATRQWRLEWWDHILQGTLFGPRFWDGWGFGLNLATEYGRVYVSDEFALRSPHNSHITILARMGVPGLLLWISLQATFAWQVLRAAHKQRPLDDAWRGRIFVWILAVWAAMMTESMFDVYLESPHGAILYWCLVGFGMVALAWDSAYHTQGPHLTGERKQDV